MIKFEHVDKVYSNGTKALSDVNLEIQQGEFVAIIGLSGAGKSTLIRTINKMIDNKDPPRSRKAMPIRETLRRFSFYNDPVGV